MKYIQKETTVLTKQSIDKMLELWNSEEFQTKREKLKKIHKKDIRVFSNVFGKYLKDFSKGLSISIDTVAVSEEESLVNLTAITECIEKLMQNEQGRLVVAYKVRNIYNILAKEYRSKSK